MKKLLSLILALMMALACVSAVAEQDAAAPAASSAGTIALKVTLVPEAISALLGAADENTAAIAQAVVDLVNNLDISMTSDGVDAEMIISLKEQPVLGMAVLKDTDKMFILSNLFPNYILKVGAGSAGSGVPSMPQISLDPEQLSALLAPVTNLIAEMQTKIGEPEAVEANFFDTPFTVRIPINITAKEAALMGLNAVKQIVSQEGFAQLLEQIKGMGLPINLSFDASSIDSAIENVNNTKDEDAPHLGAAVYSNESGDALTVINVAKDADTISVIAGSLAGGTVYEINVPGKAYCLMHSFVDGSALMNLQFAAQQGMLVTITGAFTSDETGFVGSLNVALNELDLGSIVVTGMPIGVLSGSFTTEGKTEIDVAALSDQSNEAAQGFMTDVQTGLITLLSNLVQAVPGLAGLMSQMMPQQ